MKVSVSYQSILRLAAPISLSLLIPQINFFTNTAFVGSIPETGERDLGINGVAGIFYLTLSMVGYGLATGIQTQMARRAGEGDKDGVANYFVNGGLLSALVALSLMMLSLWAGPLIFGMALSNSETSFLSISFLYIRVWGLPFLMLTQLANALLISIGQSRLMIYGQAVCVAVNILFDWLLIYGHWGFDPMGLDGAAVASVLSEIVACITVFALIFAKGIHRQYPMQLERFQLNPDTSRQTLKIAAPLMVQFLFSIGGWEVFFIFVEHLGSRELAASQILRSVLGIVSIGTWAFASTTSTMVSNLIGQKKSNLVPLLIRRIILVSLSVTAILCAILLVFAGPFLSLYRDDPGLVAFATPSLRIITVACMVMAVATVVFNGVVGTGNTLINLSIEVTAVGIYLVYCYVAIEQLRVPLHIAWMSEFVYWTSMGTIATLYLRSGRWKGKQI